MDEANSVPTMMEVNQGVEEGFAQNASVPTIETSQAQTASAPVVETSQLPPLPSQKKRENRQGNQVRCGITLNNIKLVMLLNLLELDVSIVKLLTINMIQQLVGHLA